MAATMNGTTNGSAGTTPAAPAILPPASHVEAPASVTIRSRLRGYDVLLTLRGESGADVLPRTLAALAWLDANGATPTAEPGRKPSGPPAPADPNAPRCPDHGTPMRAGSRGWYCPRKGQDGAYCTRTAPTAPEAAR